MNRILLVAIIGLLSIAGYSQKIIENPIYVTTSPLSLSVSRIELRDSCTILHFCVTDDPGSSFTVSAKSYIQPSVTGNKVLVTHAEGVKIGESMFVPSTGNVCYQLFFPPIDWSTPMIDFGEDSSNNSCSIYNMEIVPQKHSSVFPQDIEGNWFKTDGSREWVYGFQSPVVLFDSQIYEAVTVTEKDETYEIKTNKNGKALKIFIRLAPDKNLLIGTNPNKLELYSRTPLVKNDYIIPGDDEFVAPLLKSGKCVFKGYLKGYLPKMGSTGMLYDDNILTGQQNSILVEISKNGSFSAEIQVDYPHESFLSILGIYKRVFLEPGKSIFTFIDLTAPSPPSRQLNLLFMGDLARINSDLYATQSVCRFNLYQIDEKMKEITLPEFKDWMLQLGKQKKDSLIHFTETYPINKKAMQVRILNIYSKVTAQILRFSSVKKALSKNLTKTNASAELPDSTFYHFFPAGLMNSQVALVSYDYNVMLNSLLFSDVTRPGSLNIGQPLMDSIEKMGIEISAEDSQGLRHIWTGRPPKTSDPVNKGVAGSCTEFERNHNDLINATKEAITYQKSNELRKQYFNIAPGLITDIGLSRNLSNWMRAFPGPLSEYQISLANQQIRNPYIKNYILSASKSLEQKLNIPQTEIQPNTGFVNHVSPTAKADSLFETIISQNKGKLLFIDFWATWCGPCLLGIERMKPLKEEYVGKDIEFIYITDQSSPEKTYNQMVTEIRGRHYRLTQDEWNYLSSRYKISGIPHYLLIDKTGKMINNGMGSVIHSNDNLRKVFDKFLK